MRKDRYGMYQVSIGHCNKCTPPIKRHGKYFSCEGACSRFAEQILSLLHENNIDAYMYTAPLSYNTHFILTVYNVSRLELVAYIISAKIANPQLSKIYTYIRLFKEEEMPCC